MKEQSFYGKIKAKFGYPKRSKIIKYSEEPFFVISYVNDTFQLVRATTKLWDYHTEGDKEFFVERFYFGEHEIFHCFETLEEFLNHLEIKIIKNEYHINSLNREITEYRLLSSTLSNFN